MTVEEALKEIRDKPVVDLWPTVGVARRGVFGFQAAVRPSFRRSGAVIAFFKRPISRTSISPFFAAA
jgi:hypothetical protein